MEIRIEYTQQDIANFRFVIERNQHHTFVKQRVERNINGAIPDLSKESIWITMSMCLLTTQQRSGPFSPISKFLLEKPFRLSLTACSEASDVEKFVEQEIKAFGGIRFGPKIAKQMRQNFENLNDGRWNELGRHAVALLAQRKQLPMPEHYQLERKAARFMQRSFEGFGPKQSRNFWQSLGLMRYEFVLDSRVLKWLRSVNFPFPLSTMSLGEEDFYCFLSDILRDGCIQAQVIPCVLDAAIFSSFDNEEWPEDTAVW